MDLDDYCGKLRKIAEGMFGPARGDWTLGAVRIGDFGPCTIYLPEVREIEIQLSPRAEDDLLQTTYQLAHEVCHTLHPSRDAETMIAEATSVLNEGISTWFSCLICDELGWGEEARASTSRTRYAEPMKLVATLMEIDSGSVRKLRAFQPYIDRLSPLDFHNSGLIVPHDLAHSLTRPFN
jgi:hypothetical protein